MFSAVLSVSFNYTRPSVIFFKFPRSYHGSVAFVASYQVYTMTLHQVCIEKSPDRYLSIHQR